MDATEALGQISAIRQQLARTQTFRGYRAVTVGGSGILAFLIGAYQFAHFGMRPVGSLAFIETWVAVALICIAVIAAELAVWIYRAPSTARRDAILAAVTAIAPSLIAGGLLTFVVTDYCASAMWMLPGLWSILFGLGAFASCPYLPRPLMLVGIYYLTAGLLLLRYCQGESAFCAWTMPLAFGVGQIFAAVLLYATIETDPVRSPAGEGSTRA
ncbi:hypothetical protein [Stratiformator vulcanicus]|uniref:DUF2157 domain-containing protein n=1 Tax=Stratiformator vulcanicus TaxID=2527980 RepID=A0A517QYW9_9PLAN|nr:hypothetical protein [Stratiformator vulcanicus]QDT36846.1 hypothetical protein Pan189_12090 [Stratiformator vulcanicus]